MYLPLNVVDPYFPPDTEDTLETNVGSLLSHRQDDHEEEVVREEKQNFDYYLFKNAVTEQNTMETSDSGKKDQAQHTLSSQVEVASDTAPLPLPDDEPPSERQPILLEQYTAPALLPIAPPTPDIQPHEDYPDTLNGPEMSM